MSIYVEARIQGSLDELWRLTQTPEQHARWDLRFTDIEYLPRTDESRPQPFLYATRIGFGLKIRGAGETVGRHDSADGDRTSALKFWSDDSKSLIREGAGYWRYVSTDYGLRFLTSYDYRVRFGAVGRALDALAFRPLMGWATAWSFDCLRLWIERGIAPAESRRNSLIHLLARSAIGLVWLYQGIIPKLLGPHADELAMIQQGWRLGSGCCRWCRSSSAGLRVLFGVAILLSFHQRWHFLLTIVLMIVATVSVALQSPQFLSSAFNAVSLNALMIALALVGLLASRDLPSARHCLRKPPQEET